MRRTVPSFTVEVRRRPRLVATSRPNEQSLGTKPLPAFDRELHPAEAAAIGLKKADRSCVDVSAPKGRILPSLVADEPLSRLFRDASLSATDSEPTSRVRKRPSARPAKGRAYTFKPPRSSESSLADELSAASRQPTSARSDEAIGVSPLIRRCPKRWTLLQELVGSASKKNTNDKESSTQGSVKGARRRNRDVRGTRQSKSVSGGKERNKSGSEKRQPESAVGGARRNSSVSAIRLPAK